MSVGLFTVTGGAGGMSLALATLFGECADAGGVGGEVGVVLNPDMYQGCAIGYGRSTVSQS